MGQISGGGGKLFEIGLPAAFRGDITRILDRAGPAGDDAAVRQQERCVAPVDENLIDRFHKGGGQAGMGGPVEAVDIVAGGDLRVAVVQDGARAAFAVGQKIEVGLHPDQLAAVGVVVCRPLMGGGAPVGVLCTVGADWIVRAEEFSAFRRRNRFKGGAEPHPFLGIVRQAGSHVGRHSAANETRLRGGAVRRGQVIAEVSGVGDDRSPDLFDVADAERLPAPLPRLVQGRQQHRGQNGDDRYYIDLKKLIS